MKTEVRVNQYFYNLQYFHLSLTYGEWGDENIQCCSKTVSGTYPTRDGHDKSFSSHLAKILWWMEECLASGRPFHSSPLSLHLQVVYWPHPSSCLIKSISPPWRKRRGTLYVIDQNISRNLGREWSILEWIQTLGLWLKPQWVEITLCYSSLNAPPLSLSLQSKVADNLWFSWEIKRRLRQYDKGKSMSITSQSQEHILTERCGSEAWLPLVPMWRHHMRPKQKSWGHRRTKTTSVHVVPTFRSLTLPSTKKNQYILENRWFYVLKKKGKVQMDMGLPAFARKQDCVCLKAISVVLKR